MKEEKRAINLDDFEDYQYFDQRAGGSGGGKKKDKKQGPETRRKLRETVINASKANVEESESLEIDLDVVLEKILKLDEAEEGLPHLTEYIFWISKSLKENKFEKRDYLVPKEEVDFEAMRKGGPGGQNVNKVASKVRLTHKLGWWVVVIDELRDQVKNRELAYVRLTELVKEHLYRWRELTKGEKVDSSIAMVLDSVLENKIEGDTVKMQKKGRNWSG